MNYQKAWKKRKKSELKRLAAVANGFILQANTQDNLLAALPFVTQAAIAWDQFLRVLAQQFKCKHKRIKEEE